MEISGYSPGLMDVLVHARAEAKRLGHGEVGPGHLLLGNLRMAYGLAYVVMTAMGIDFSKLAAEIELLLEAQPHADRGQNRSDSAEAVLRGTGFVAGMLGHNWVGTEHLLIALANSDDAVLTACLRRHGLDAMSVTAHVLTQIELGQRGLPS